MEPQKEEQEQILTTQPQKKNMIGLFFAGLLVVVLVAGAGVFMYTKTRVAALSDSSFVLASAQVFNIPIAKINGHRVSYHDFMTDFSSLKNFYSQQDQGATAVTDTDISQQVISRLLINALINEYAKKYNVTVDQSDVDVAKSELLSQFPDEETAAQEVQKTFGWSLQTFTERVINPIVVEQKVGEAFEQDTTVGDTYKATQVKARHILFTVDDEHPIDEVKAQAGKVLQRIKDGEDFASLAAEFGSDGTSETGGDLGWIDRGTTIPEFEDVIFAMSAGELYDGVVETQFGIHIVQVDDVKTINDFAAFFQDQLKAADVKIYSDIANPFAVADSATDNVTTNIDSTPEQTT
ncbi:MAG: PPIC-type PPIASE domain protein [Candidatus Magasanikbacteria bacterium GW2011_GWD2_43_18]|nr:MAG: PPIC-type PPIASE domain protein [Candidatus Magasanikbacteria bacterium GW2011_GWC2_42_27]KKT03929.1 MAG: PPIC-type PPIASE domain protein [Candidatus Magasanikbacteria bacterium GW2011_GWD2_43_18]KKT25588.1 MAG: PPIC-type PPIASE domain protein [Candidatus Magasanikbacteria bacterium GW2011_GWA2_43_9]